MCTGKVMTDNVRKNTDIDMSQVSIHKVPSVNIASP